MKKYDSYGFEVEGWADDVQTQAAHLVLKSAQLASSLNEVRVVYSLFAMVMLFKI
mgnify:CR=1